MKELSIKEKAKRYDEAMKAAVIAHKDEDRHLKATLERIFPELKESEDEKIRKELISYFQYMADNYPNDIKYAKVGNWIAWLEKQGKQKETLCDKCKKTQPSHSCQDITALGRCALEKQGEQKLTDFEKSVKQVMEEAIECGDTRNLKADAEMLLSLVHKSAWSEEDENMLKMVIESCEQCGNGYAYYWLKHLKDRVQPQSAWKPSDEQIKAVKEAACYSSVFSEKTIDNLISLSKQLKKLREEQL